MVSCNQSIYPTVTNTYNLGSDQLAWSKVYASTGFYQTSDINKKNITGDLDLNEAYKLIDKCQTILYTLKDDPSNKQEIGLIAQEVKEIFPELISEDEQGTLSLDYAKLTVVLLRVMKDVISRLEKLENNK